jgi:hypothetical protein
MPLTLCASLLALVPLQEEADKEAEALKVAIVRAGKELPEDAIAPSDSCNTIRDRILNFLSKDLALMTLLANPGIKERHWEQMAATVGFALPHSEVRSSARQGQCVVCVVEGVDNRA